MISKWMRNSRKSLYLRGKMIKSPHLVIFVLFGQVPERSNGADCKSVGSAFGGSNPSLPTIEAFVEI